MKVSRWPDWLEGIDGVWAKSRQEGQMAGESLAKHTWLVLERFSELARLRPSLGAHLAAPNIWHCLFWACFLHDFGKAASGFQKMVRDGERWGQRHEVLSLAFLDWIAPALSETERKWVLAAIVSHHRDADEIASKYDERMNPDPLVGLLAQLEEKTVRRLWRWLVECATAWIEALNLLTFDVHPLQLVDEEEAIRMTCVEGVQRTRTWLSLYRSFIRKLPSERDQCVVATLVTLRGLTTTADHMASAHLPQVPQGIQRSWEDFVGQLSIQTYRHQEKSAASQNRSAMLVAPTGSGKTEAAIFWAMGTGTQAVPRIFYALPYQASMNAMYDRLCLPHYFGENRVGLQHGRALQALYQRLMNSEQGPKTAKQGAKWRENLSRLHAYPIKVFSPYQMIKIIYQIKGFEGMLTDYAQAAFIFDEIHAYEPNRLAMILALIKYLREHYGARFFIMSATFSSILQKIMPDVLGMHETIVADRTLFEQFRRHHLHLLDGDLLEQGIDRIVTDVQSGKSVLVCCSTVQRAQDIQSALLKRLPSEQIELIHSRFTMEDRLKREGAIVTRCNIDAKHTALAVVATQVVEVSLNIDLDTIYTDPAPLDALVQRFGRVNRARKKSIVPVYVFRQPDNGQHVYDDVIVQRSLAVLEMHDNEDIDEAAISEWLDEIYTTPEIYNRWMSKYHTQYELVAQLLRNLRPFNSDEKSEEMFEALFDGVEVLPQCFERQYVDHQVKDEFIEASRLFVSISQKKYQQLARRGKIRMVSDEIGKDKRWLVRQEYSSEYGLIFDSSRTSEPDYD
ncbi:MAG: CRISPR-associated helicase Cas3' [Ktedonobacteraceae bacterium]